MIIFILGNCICTVVSISETNQLKAFGVYIVAGWMRRENIYLINGTGTTTTLQIEREIKIKPTSLKFIRKLKAQNNTDVVNRTDHFSKYGYPHV